MEQQIKVSIYVLAFNHENYIRECLDGILMQRTDFPFEAIVHDDASQDRTASIIREYEEKYPEIIKAVYQKENQHSKGVKIFDVHIVPRLRGKYVAICEGDDYWTDPDKLAKQVAYLDAHPECNICVTNGTIVDQAGNNPPRNFVPFTKEDAAYYKGESRKYTLDNLYQLTFVPTASIVFLRSVLEKLPDTFWKSCPNGDLKKRLYFAALGETYYLDDITCAYRQNVPNSAMTRWKVQSRTAAFARCQKVIEMIDDVNAFSGFRYADGLMKIQTRHIISAMRQAPSLAVLNDFLRVDKNRGVFLSLSLFERMKIRGKAMLPERAIQMVKTIKTSVH